MHNIHFILTGGTLTMDNNPEGYTPAYDVRHLLTAVKIKDSNLDAETEKKLLKQVTELKTNRYEKETLQAELDQILAILGVRSTFHLLNEYSISPYVMTPFQSLSGLPNSNVTKFGLIDSIDFDFSIHYPALAQTVEQALKGGQNSAIVLGGTDTLEFYATGLTADMQKKGLLKDSNMTFVSSMYSFEENPSHVASLVKGALEAARTVTDQKGTTSLKGAYLLSPELSKDDEVKAVKLHDISKGIVKISSQLKDAFRSNNGITDVIEFSKDGAAHHHTLSTINPEMKERTSLSTGINVAPTLIYGNNPEVIQTYLEHLLYLSFSGKQPFDIVPIEGLENILKSTKSPKIINTIKHLSYHGIRIAFINDEAPLAQNEKSFKPKSFQPISSQSQAILQLKSAGCLFESGPSTQVYTSLKFGLKTLPPIIVQYDQDEQKFKKPEKSSQPLKIKYIPDQELFKSMLKIASEVSSHIVIEALPGQAIPNYYKDTMSELTKAGTQITVGFKYNGKQYNENSKTFVEGAIEDNLYASSKWLKDAGIKVSGLVAPADVGVDKSLARSV